VGFRVVLVEPLFYLTFSASVVARGDTSPAAKDIVRQALHAVEVDSIAPLHRRWSARLQQDSSDRMLRLADGQYVVERYTVSTAPSATILAELWRHPRTRDQDHAASLLALGDPAFGRDLATGAPAQGEAYAVLDSAERLPPGWIRPRSSAGGAIFFRPRGTTWGTCQRRVSPLP
jgi:hypothetical protein